MIEDTELLRRYAEDHSEAAFAELVQRRIGLVYAVALRRTEGDSHRAQDITQSVFSDLARKAGSLCRRPLLIGWLHRSAQFAANDVRRAAQRRSIREQEAHTMQQLTGDDGPEPDWKRFQPVLDEVLNELDERDRAAILLRFFENRPFAEIGLKLRLTENAARMRVERALDKLHALLARRGVTSTTAALGLVLATQAAAAAPAGLAATVTGVALVAGTTTGLGFAAVFMSSIKLQLGVTAAILAAGTIGVVVQSRANAGWRDEIAALHPPASSLARLRRENESLSRAAAEVAMLRQDDAELARLQDQVAAVKARQEQAARAETAARAARAAAFAALPVYTPDQLDQQPTPTYQARPNYPFEARRSGTSGQAVVSFVVNPAGEVADVQAVSTTQADFGAAAVAAVQQWQFKPGQKAGQPVNARMQVPIVFTLNDDDGPPLPAPSDAFTIEQSKQAAPAEPPLDGAWF